MELRTENVVKVYRSRTVVNEVSVNVRQGEIVGLQLEDRMELGAHIVGVEALGHRQGDECHDISSGEHRSQYHCRRGILPRFGSLAGLCPHHGRSLPGMWHSGTLCMRPGHR